MMENKNLESIINKIAFEIVDEGILDSNEINKLLGVLSNDGVYAMWVYCKAEKKIEENKLINKLTPIFQLIIPAFKSENEKEYENAFQKIAEDLNNLLFIKELLEKILIYARYHAKAMEE